MLALFVYLFSNIANYAYNPETGPAAVRVAAGNDIIIEFEDSGIAYDPLAKSDPVLRAEYIDNIKEYQIKGREEGFCRFIAERVLETEKEICRMYHIDIKRNSKKN